MNNDQLPSFQALQPNRLLIFLQILSTMSNHSSPSLIAIPDQNFLVGILESKILAPAMGRKKKTIFSGW